MAEIQPINVYPNDKETLQIPNKESDSAELQSRKKLELEQKSKDVGNSGSSEDESESDDKRENEEGNTKPTTKFIFENEDGGSEKSKKGGRRKINIEFIENKSRRHVTFSKRKTGLIKKAYELSTLTGTQVLLLIASETGNVYTFATPKLQPLITHQEGKQLIQKYLNPPEVPESPSPLPPQPPSRTPSPPSNISMVQPHREIPESPSNENLRKMLDSRVTSINEGFANYGGFPNFPRYSPSNISTLPSNFTSNFLPIPRNAPPMTLPSAFTPTSSAFNQVNQQLAYLQRNTQRPPFVPLNGLGLPSQLPSFNNPLG